jgi:hypothetical protein
LTQRFSEPVSFFCRKERIFGRTTLLIQFIALTYRAPRPERGWHWAYMAIVADIIKAAGPRKSPRPAPMPIG